MANKILKIFSDANFKQGSKKKKHVLSFGYTFYVDNIKVYEYFKPSVETEHVKNSLEAELFSILHAMDTVRQHKGNILHFNILNAHIYCDCIHVPKAVETYGVKDLLHIPNLPYQIFWLTRNHPKIKYIDSTIRI